MSSTSTAATRQRDGDLVEMVLQNERIALSFLPEWGCHWTSLKFSVKGAWLDFLVPFSAADSRGTGLAATGCFLMAPWCSRVQGGCFEFEEQRYELERNSPDGAAIHGDVRGRPWQVVDVGENRFRGILESRDHDDFNYPFALDFTLDLTLTGDTLRCGLWIENRDREAAPVSLGFHPFVRRRLTSRDRDVYLVVPADSCYPAKGGLADGPPAPVRGELDLRPLRPFGNRDLDHCYTSLTRDYVRLIYPGSGCEVRSRFGGIFTHHVIYAPRTEEGHAADFVAVEPVTAAPDAFNRLARGESSTGVRILESGERAGGFWEISIGDL